MIPSGPEDMDVDPRREHAFRRGYISGVYDALLGVKSRLTQEEFSRLEAWVQQGLSPWTTTNLEKAVRPPVPSDSTLLPSLRKHEDGPFTLPQTRSWELIRVHLMLNSPEVSPDLWRRRNHFMYEFLCYVNNLIGCELSENQEGSQLFIERSRSFMQKHTKDSETNDAQIENYFALVRAYIHSLEDKKGAFDDTELDIV
jgi:hypothetical protein